MEQKLTKAQVGTLQALAMQRMQIEKAYSEIAEAEREQYAVLAKYYDLPDGEYSVRQEQDGTVYLVAIEKEDGSNG